MDEFSVRYFSTVVISAVATSVIGRAVFGYVPTFLDPIEYGISNRWEYPTAIPFFNRATS